MKPIFPSVATTVGGTLTWSPELGMLVSPTYQRLSCNFLRPDNRDLGHYTYAINLIASYMRNILYEKHWFIDDSKLVPGLSFLRLS